MLPAAKFSRKVLVCGCIAPKKEKENYRKFVEENANKAGVVEELLVEVLPSDFLFPELRHQNLAAMTATVTFEEAETAAKFTHDFNGSFFNPGSTSALEALLIHESLEIKDIVHRVEIPDWNAVRLTYGLLCGVFLDTSNERQLSSASSKLKKTLRDLVKYVHLELVNLTQHFKLERHGKDAFAAVIEFYDNEDAEKARETYNGLKFGDDSVIHFKLHSELIPIDRLLEFVPRDLTMYQSKPGKFQDLLEESDSDDSCKDTYNVIAKGMKISRGSRTEAKWFFSDLFRLGCNASVGLGCKKCSKPVKINRDKVQLQFARNDESLEVLKNFNGRCTKFGVLKLEVEQSEATPSPKECANSQLQLSKTDVVVFLPMSQFGLDDEKDLRELTIISEKFKNVSGFVNQEIILPKTLQNGSAVMQKEIILMSSYKTETYARRAIQELKHMKSWEKEVKIELGANVDLSGYEFADENDDQDSTLTKNSKNLVAKVWRRKLSEAKILDFENRNEDAMTHYKYIFAQTISNEFQRIASDAAAGISGLHIKGNQLDKAVEEIVASVSEIKSQFVTPLLLRQLATAFILSKNIHAAAFICVYAVTAKFRMHNYFQALLVHLQEHYPAQIKELNDQFLSKGRGFMKLEVEEAVETAAGIRIISKSAVNEKQLKADMRSFLFWRAICPEEKEIEMNPEALKNSTAVLISHVENGARSLRASNFPAAANSFKEALSHAEGTNDKVVIQYCLAIALLDSKSIENVKEGLSVLRELYKTNLLVWNQEFPAIIYGLARYELAINEPAPSFLDYDLKACDKSIPWLCQSEFAETLPESNANLVPQLLSKLKSEYPSEPLATCRYDLCQQVHDKLDRASVIKWKPTIHKNDLDFKGYFKLHCTDDCVIVYHPWCWKNKKERDGINLDKDYLKQHCFTPDCYAPISKIIVVKEDHFAIEISDKQMTEKLLNEAIMKAKIPVESHNPKRAPHDTNAGAVKKARAISETERQPSKSDKNDVEAANALRQEMESLRLQLDQTRANEKAINKQLKASMREKDDIAKKLEESKSTSKRLMDENRQARQSMVDAQQALYGQLEAMKRDNDRLSHELRRLKNRADIQASSACKDEYTKFAKFVAFINENLLPSSNELPILYGNLIFKAETVSSDTKSVLTEPNYGKLLMEIHKAQTASVLMPPSPHFPVGGATAVMPTTTGPKKEKFQVIIDQVVQVFPHLSGDEIAQHLIEIRKLNNGLKNMTLNEIINQISIRMESEGGEECSICLNAIENPETKKKLSCGHEFHSVCISGWFKEKRDCPLCRHYYVPHEEFPALNKKGRGK